MRVLYSTHKKGLAFLLGPKIKLSLQPPEWRLQKPQRVLIEQPQQ